MRLDGKVTNSLESIRGIGRAISQGLADRYNSVATASCTKLNTPNSSSHPNYASSVVP